MSNMFLLRKRHQRQDIRKKPLRLVMNIFIGLIVLTAVVFFVIEVLIKPNISIESVEINYVTDEIPISDEIYSLANSLLGIPFNSAKPSALEVWFLELEEIEHIEISRTWSGSLTFSLTPRVPLFLIADEMDSEDSNVELSPIDKDGKQFSANREFISFFKNQVPVFTVENPELILDNTGVISDNIMRAAQLINELKAYDEDTYNLITNLKYYNNNRHNYASAFMQISDMDIEFQLSWDLQLEPFITYINAVSEHAKSGDNMYSRVAVYNDKAVCRL